MVREIACTGARAGAALQEYRFPCTTLTGFRQPENQSDERFTVIRKIVATTALCLGCGAFAQENQPLVVGFNDQGCPTEVTSTDQSCGNGPDPVNVACRSNGAVVRWGPGASIREIIKKEPESPEVPESPGELHNCGHVSDFYQCVVKGNIGDEIKYDVIAANGCPMDPVIRVR